MHLTRLVFRHDLNLLRRNGKMLGGIAFGLGSVLLLVLANAKERPASELIGLYFFLFVGAAISVPVAVATNALVLEKERGTIEPLLLLPISPRALVAGKAAVTIVLSLIGLVVVYVVGIAATAMLGRPDAVRIFFDPRILYTALFLAPLMVIPFSLAAIAISAKSPDSQTASATAFVTLIPLFAVMFSIWLGYIRVGQRLLGASTLILLGLCWVAFRVAVSAIDPERMIKRRS